MYAIRSYYVSGAGPSPERILKARGVRVIAVEGLRITSYNVCYTKLLRKEIDRLVNSSSFRLAKAPWADEPELNASFAHVG